MPTHCNSIVFQVSAFDHSSQFQVLSTEQIFMLTEQTWNSQLKEGISTRNFQICSWKTVIATYSQLLAQDIESTFNPLYTENLLTHTLADNEMLHIQGYQ